MAFETVEDQRREDGDDVRFDRQSPSHQSEVNLNTNIKETLSFKDPSPRINIRNVTVPPVKVNGFRSPSLSNDSNSTEDHIHALHEQAIDLLEAGYREQAIVLIKKVIKQFISLPNLSSFLNEAKLYTYLEVYAICVSARSEKMDECRKAIRRLRELVCAYPGRFDVYLAAGLVHTAKTMHDSINGNRESRYEALKYCSEGLQILQNLKDPKGHPNPRNITKALSIGSKIYKQMVKESMRQKLYYMN